MRWLTRKTWVPSIFTERDRRYQQVVKEQLGEEFDFIEHRKYLDEDSHNRLTTHVYLPMTDHEAASCYVALSLKRLLASNGHGCLKVVDIGSPIAVIMGVATNPQIELEMVDIRRHPHAHQFPFPLRQADITRLPYPDQSVDVVTCALVLTHLGEGRYDDDLNPLKDQLALKELARVLKPHGYLILVPGCLMRGRPTILYNVHRIYTPRWLSNTMARSGLTISEFRFYDAIHGRDVYEESLPTHASLASEQHILGFITALKTAPSEGE